MIKVKDVRGASLNPEGCGGTEDAKWLAGQLRTMWVMRLLIGPIVKLEAMEDSSVVRGLLVILQASGESKLVRVLLVTLKACEEA